MPASGSMTPASGSTTPASGSTTSRIDVPPPEHRARDEARHERRRGTSRPAPPRPALMILPAPRSPLLIPPLAPRSCSLPSPLLIPPLALLIPPLVLLIPPLALLTPPLALADRVPPHRRRCLCFRGVFDVGKGEGVDVVVGGGGGEGGVVDVEE
ncbi:hypothetical protein K525DRAFT_275314 [Schizophyllum commune Loenen D]|nr:hypothetical protein K525DRAFT_275314 [Schizophyllum commune Loenen D]